MCFFAECEADCETLLERLQEKEIILKEKENLSNNLNDDVVLWRLKVCTRIEERQYNNKNNHAITKRTH